MLSLRPREKKLLLLLLLAVCVVVPVRYIYLPFTARIAAVKELLMEERQKLQTMELTLARWDRFQAEYAEALEAVAARERRLVAEYELPYVMRELDYLARREGVKLTAANPSTVATGDGISRIHLTLSIEGGYKEITDYFQQMKGLPFPVAVLQFTLRSNAGTGSGPAPLSVSVEVAVWVRAQGGVKFAG